MKTNILITPFNAYEISTIEHAMNLVINKNTRIILWEFPLEFKLQNIDFHPKRIIAL